MKKSVINNELERTETNSSHSEFVPVRISSLLIFIMLLFFMFIYEPKFIADFQKVLSVQKGKRCMMLKDKTKLVVWPVYLDATRSRAEGRILSMKDAVKSPTLKEMEKAALELNLSPVVEADKAHPKSWWVVSGRVLVDKKGPKSIIVKQIAQTINKARGQK